jgi:hypothetical protein
VLGVVLLWPADEPSDATSGAALASPEEIAQLAAGKSAGDSQATRVWPTVSLEDVLAVNPFEPLPEAEQTEVEPAVADSGGALPGDAPPIPPKPKRPYAKVEAILETGGVRVAVIDSKAVRVGDVLPHGRVVEITSDAVIFEEE